MLDPFGAAATGARFENAHLGTAGGQWPCGNTERNNSNELQNPFVIHELLFDYMFPRTLCECSRLSERTVTKRVPGTTVRLHRIRNLCHALDGWYSKSMGRGPHILIAVIAVFLLVRPFDCLGSNTLNKKAADCCKHGKCVPTTNSDDCCKATVPGGNQIIVSKDHHPSAVSVDLAENVLAAVLQPVQFRIVAEADSPPDSPPDRRL